MDNIPQWALDRAAEEAEALRLALLPHLQKQMRARLTEQALRLGRGE